MYLRATWPLSLLAGEKNSLFGTPRFDSAASVGATGWEASLGICTAGPSLVVGGRSRGMAELGPDDAASGTEGVDDRS